ncbi:MAG: N-acetyl sugar amidotransferase [Candidatus Yanofskybacteria bacterium]|nr:N-acetyl sugar amidotransferase [Candidatus Yanofskybacteria bacterium]
MNKVKYCTNCVYPTSSAVPLAFDDKGVCSGCRTSREKKNINWDERKKKFEKLIEEYRNKNGTGYDIMIPVSGGKDSYFQVHLMKKVYGLNPLLVTYNGNNYTPTGMENLINMRNVFGVDHVFFTANVDVLKILNRLGVQILGDMQWHYASGIYTYPIRVAVETKTPLMLWGEHGHMDLGGMHSYNDFVEFTYRYRHEHVIRGFEWTDFLKRAPEFGEKLTKQQLIPWMYPSDEQIASVGVRGIYTANYFKWDANIHGPLMIKKYGFKVPKEPFERTYRKMSNLDDMHENGVHDYLKFIKFGYGRATDHCCKDIRSGIMTRDQAIKIVKKMDRIKPKDTYRWLKYVGWTEEKFDKIADTFRDPRVWWIKDGQWWKDNLWGKPSAYGKVHLDRKQQEKYRV